VRAISLYCSPGKRTRWGFNKHAWPSRMRPYSHDLGNRVGGPGDYLFTERLAVDLLVGAQFLGL
jgi:hypothetical protein